MKTIEDIIQDQIRNMDLDYMVSEAIHKLISDEVKRKLVKITEQRITEIINTEIEIQMAKGIKTDDGWGKKEQYESFEALFKKVFSEKLNNSWDIKREIEKHIKDKCDMLYKEQVKHITEKLKTELLKS